jgi:hypothetical protein
VAPFAFDHYVGPFKREIRYAVVKNLLVKPNDIEFPSLVFRMTVLTLVRFYIFAESMKAEPLVDVFSNLLMAIQTQLLLRFLVEEFVTAVAFLFILYMTLNDFAGHDDALHVCRSKICWRQYQDHDTYSPGKMNKNSTLYPHPCRLRTCVRR